MANIVETIKANPLILVGVAGGGLVLYLVLKNKGTTPNSGQPLYYPSGGSQPGTWSPSYIAPLPSPVPPVPPGPPMPHPFPGPYICAPGYHHENGTTGRCVPDVPIPGPPGPGNECDNSGDARECPPGMRCVLGHCVPFGPPEGPQDITEPVLSPMSAGTDGGPLGAIFSYGGKGGGKPSAATEAVPYREVYNTVTALHSMRRT